MSEWWTYRPSDFLMYSPRSWGRLLEALHGDVWPWQFGVAALALLTLALVWRRWRFAVPWTAAVLALAWAFVGWEFDWKRLSDISTAAPWFAAAAGLQVLLLATIGWQPAPHEAGAGWRATGWIFSIAALVLAPLVAPVRGLGWAQAELPGLTPDATALFTVGVLLALPFRFRAWLLPVPAATLAVGLTMQWLMLLR